jgi:hypothetical protein
VRTRLLLLLILVWCPISVFASGASYATIKIRPITYNERGDVLFKALENVNFSGSTNDQTLTYYWLVITSEGGWSVTVHKKFSTTAAGESDYVRNAEVYRSQFEYGFDWSAPPATVKDILRKYDFKAIPGFNDREGEGRVRWAPSRVCLDDRCIRKNIVQRTLQNNSSGQGSEIGNVFYHKGIALFRNGNYDDRTSEVHTGAFFGFYGEKNGVDVEYQRVDGIIILPAVLNNN